MRLLLGTGILAVSLLIAPAVAGAGAFCFQIPGTGKCLLIARDGTGATSVVLTRATQPEQPQAPGGESSDGGQAASSTSGGHGTR